MNIISKNVICYNVEKMGFFKNIVIVYFPFFTKNISMCVSAIMAEFAIE